MLDDLFLPKVSMIYSGLMGLLYLAFTIYVIRMRLLTRTSMGHDNNPESLLFRAVRIHGNFSEYVPFILLLMLIDEITGGNARVLHFMGFMLLTGRISLYLGFKKTHGSSPERMIGMLFTFVPVLYFSLSLIYKGLS